MRQTQIVLLVFLICPTLVACDTASPPAESYAIPAPPPVAPYSEDVNANATAVAANATAQAAYVNAVNARENARTAAAKGTAMARSTDRALETRGTEVALMATSTAMAMQATLQAAALQATIETGRVNQEATADGSRINQQATTEADRINQQATVQAQTFLVQATGIALSATGTAVAVQSHQERAAAEWESTVVMPAKKVGIVILIVLLLLALAFFGVRLFDALILRARIIRDPSGHAIILPERDPQGRQMLLLPNRTPGPVLQLVPPQVQPQQVSVDGTDAEVTQRAQVLEAMGMTQPQLNRPTAPRAQSESASARHIGSLTQMAVVRLIPTDQLPPAQIADGPAIEAIDADWRRSDE